MRNQERAMIASRGIPQGLKPAHFFGRIFGTAEAEP
jgi:hypothetical protein